MEYEFHTTLPIQRRDGDLQDVWIAAILSWDPLVSTAPRVKKLYCNDEEILRFWASAGSAGLEAAIITDAMKLHMAPNMGDNPNEPLRS